MRLAMLVLLATVMGAALAAVAFSSYGYAQQDRIAIAAASDRQHVAGTDEVGRDRAVRVGVAVTLGMVGAGLASLTASGLSMFLGGLAACVPGWFSKAVLFCGDLFLTLPWIFLLMLVRSALPLNLPPVQSGAITFLLLALLGAPAFLRLNHERTTSLLRADWLLQANASGLRRSQIAKYMLPHLRPLFWTQCLLYVPACIVAEANLGALGLGISEPVPSWGNMLAGLQSAALLSNSHWVYLPIALLVLVLAALELTIFGAKS